jgi:hypothetical protein
MLLQFHRLSMTISKAQFCSYDSPLFFPHEMDKLTVVLMPIKRLNKERQPLEGCNTDLDKDSKGS